MNDNRDHLRALLAAFNAEMGVELTLDREREKTLREVDKKGLTPDDMRAVMRHLRGLVSSDDRRYTESSLLFENAVGSWSRPVLLNRFESMARLLRKRRPAAVRAARPDPVSPEEEKRLAALRKAEMEDFKRRMGR
jgi:hypothetical protein